MLALHELYMLLTLVHTVSDGCSVDSETSEELALWYCFRGLWKLSLRMCWSIRPTWLADHNVRYMICCSLFWLVNIKVKSPRLHLSEVHININIYIYMYGSHCVRWLLSGLRNIWGFGLVCFRGLWKLSPRMCWSIRPTWLAVQNVRYMIYCSLFGLVNVKMKSPRLHLSEVHIYIYVWFTLCQMAAQWTPKHLRIWPCVLQGPVETLTANVLINTTNLIGGSKCQIYDILFSFWTCQCQNEITTATSKRGSFTLYY